MKKAKDTDMEIKVALMDQGFFDIKKRLDYIEGRIEHLTATINRGMGAWKAVIFIASTSGAVISFLFK